VDAAFRPPDHPLIDRLLKEGHRFSFYQAAGLLERAMPEATPVGGTGPAAREAIRFRPDPSLGFPAGSIERIEWVEDHWRIDATFLGLYGADSPLPTHWSEDILHEQAYDTTVRDFLDIFHHRVYSLLFRLWAKYRFAVQYRGTDQDTLTDRLLCLIGLGSPEIRRETGLPVVRLLRWAGLFVQQPRSAAGLEVLVSDWLDGVPVTVHPAVGRWMPVAVGDRTRLGQRHTVLGQDALLGDRIHDVTGRFGLEIGPVDAGDYDALLPDGEEHARLNRLVRLYTSDPLEVELNVRLKGSDVPDLVLDSARPPGLGWTTWLKTGPVDDQDVVFSLRESA
jgi:type VI secretion system protein ImpH